MTSVVTNQPIDPILLSFVDIENKAIVCLISQNSLADC
jgi:hypothetical protein